MAQPIPCDICRSTTADMVVTVVSDGQVIGVGVECLLDWALPIAEAYAQAVAREQGDPGTVDVTALDPPDAPPPSPVVRYESDFGRPVVGDAPVRGETISVATGPDEGTEASDADWEASARPTAPRGRKKGAGAKAAGGREDPDTSPAAHVDG